MNNIKETDSKKRDEYSYRMLSNYLAQNLIKNFIFIIINIIN